MRSQFHHRILLASALVFFFCEQDQGQVESIPDRTDQVATAPDAAALRTRVFQCEDSRFTVQSLADTAWLYYNDTVVVLRRIGAESGEKYKNGEFLCRIQKGKARIETPNESFESCVIDKQAIANEAARLRGVDFRGLGQEPGWLLEIYEGDSIVFSADYGTERYVGEATEPQTINNGEIVRYTTIVDTGRLQVRIVKDSCTDVMSGFAFPSTVTVRINEKRYQGCGKSL